MESIQPRWRLVLLTNSFLSIDNPPWINADIVKHFLRALLETCQYARHLLMVQMSRIRFSTSSLFFFFSVRLLSVLRGHSVFSSPPQRPMSSEFEGFLYQILSITIFSYLNSWERASIFPFQWWVLNKGTSGTIFITSLVWRGPWLGIKPGTSRTRSQHSTTRLSRRRCHLLITRTTFWLISHFHQTRPWKDVEICGLNMNVVLV